MPSPALVLPETTRSALQAFRDRVRIARVVEGVLAAAGGLLSSYLLVLVPDRFFDTPAVLRGLFLAAGTLGPGLWLLLQWHRWVWGTRRLDLVAKLVRLRDPALGDQLLGAVELSQTGQLPGSSLRLAQAAMAQVDNLVRQRGLSGALPHPRHPFWWTICAVPAGLCLAGLVLVPAASGNALVRWLMPWRSIDRYTFARVEPLPERVVVPHGEEFPLLVELTKQSRWQPETATARLGELPKQTTSRRGSRYEFRFPPQTRPGRLDLRVGDLTKSMVIEPWNRPELKNVTASIRLPEYLQREHPVRADVRGGSLSILKGAAAEFVATVSRELREARVNGQPAALQGDQIQALPLVVTESATVEFHWQDNQGLTPRDAFRLKVTATDDNPPLVSLQQQEPQAVILTTDVITLDVQSRDDFGIRRIGLEWGGVVDPVRNPQPDRGEKLVQAGSPEQLQLRATATFCADSEKLPAQTIELRAWSEDYCPDRGRQYSPGILLQVMTPEQHTAWILDQMRRWAAMADDVYEEEMRLHDENRRLRQLDPAAWDAPETRRQIEQQAVAEDENSRRLKSATEIGDKLLQQALRNREMLVGHLETWAGGLQRLRVIAEQRMPSVASLLRDSARAPGVRSGESASAGQRVPHAGHNRSTPTEPLNQSQPPHEEHNPAPGVSDLESGFIPDQGSNVASSARSGVPTLGLPSTVLSGGPPVAAGDQDVSPAEIVLDNALTGQSALLTEFERIREDLQKILGDLENSTFVKRLKAASREQLDVAAALNRTLFHGFGVGPSDLQKAHAEQTERIAVLEDVQVQNVGTIQSDLQAYLDRRPDAKFERILKQMTESGATSELSDLSSRIRENQVGDAISRAEFWADTLDRWAEEMVSPSKCGQCRGSSGDSLPPSIVLEVMRILDGEIDLREQTRALELVRGALAADDFRDKAHEQSAVQRSLHNRCVHVVNDIRALSQGAERFRREIDTIVMASDAMEEAIDILNIPETGPPAIAAETEAIELLLQSRRAGQGKRGGGSGSSPGGGGTGTTDRVALELYGPGTDANARIETREVRQLTGTTADQIPAEYRDGVEAFLNALDGGRR